MWKLNGKSRVNDIQSRLEYYKNLYEIERKKNESQVKEIVRINKDFEDYRAAEKEKNNILINDSKEKENSNFKLKNDIKSLADANKNFIIEINALNNIIEMLYKQQEIMSFELSFYKNELHLTYELIHLK